MRVFTPHVDRLPAAQQLLWPALRPIAPAGVVLYGGTAITLRLGHRASMDFDFFTERPLFKEALRATLPWLAQAITLQNRRDTLTVLTSAGPPGDATSETSETTETTEPNQVNVSFFGSLRFGRVDEPEMTADQVAQVASLRDLLATKLLATKLLATKLLATKLLATKLKVILGRIEAKDYRDIAALIGAGARLDQGLADAQALYGRTGSACLSGSWHRCSNDLWHARPPPDVCRGPTPFSSPPLPRSGIRLVWQCGEDLESIG